MTLSKDQVSFPISACWLARVHVCMSALQTSYRAVPMRLKLNKIHFCSQSSLSLCREPHSHSKEKNAAILKAGKLVREGKWYLGPCMYHSSTPWLRKLPSPGSEMVFGTCMTHTRPWKPLKPSVEKEMVFGMCIRQTIHSLKYS
jgi:hypothetical protein